ncbi:hypothetical protein [Methanobacterium sp. BAmetb5]|uniref:hypothetical protein n=1 Tax=Methanobacterium sp. BAmetb5 TaxID=2025351 RepID=UPI000E9FF4F5|nr:hypothetical protein [Methanobacterium sp. BAmetb5]AXV38986.1 MAG: hypothetical protein CIT02_00995 [Methanobacterium sp. BAmetb5]
MKRIETVQKNNNIKFIPIILGIIVILLFSASFSQSNSPLDLLFITMGIIVFIPGVSSRNEKFLEKIIYFGVMFGINLFQWLLVINILLISKIPLTIYTLFVLAVVPMVTIYLINQILKSDLKYLEKNQNKDAIMTDRIKWILIFVGITILIICLIGFALSLSPIYLYGSSVGMLLIVYGYYRENKKLNITRNYFLTMSFLFLLQWIVLIFLIRHVNALNGPSYNFSFTFSLLLTSVYFDQIRNSHLIKINWQGIFIGEKKIF